MYKRIITALLIVLLLAVLQPAYAEQPQRGLTVMIYMCGSNLESNFGSASADLQEIMDTDFDASQTAVLAMLGGANTWSTGYDPGKSHILELRPKRSRVVWSDTARDMGEAASLTHLIRFGIERYPARDYALILWNHGGGPMEGVCWDELFSMDSLSLSELARALEDAQLPGKLRWIGFDACLMSSAEVAAAVAPYAEYMIASQETEPASGWNYSFLTRIGDDKNGGETGRRIVDAYFDSLPDTSDALTLSCVDLSRIEPIQKALDSFFSPIGESLTRESFTAASALRFSATGFGKAVRGIEENSYDLVDLRDLVEHYSRNTSGSRVLDAVGSAVVYSRSSIDGASGLSIYHPFSNKRKYVEKWKSEYAAMTFSSGYEDYLQRFGALLTGEVMASWRGMQTLDRTEEDGNSLFTLQLTPEQQETFAEAQLIVLAARDLHNGIYGTQTTALEGAEKGDTLYSPVYVADAQVDDQGQLTADYSGRTLYAVDETGTPLLGPLSYQLSDDGSTYYIRGTYLDRSGRENSAGDMSVMFAAVPETDGDGLRIISVRGYDPATKTYTNRIPVVESEYTDLRFYPELRYMPDDLQSLSGFDQWETNNRPDEKSIRLPLSWHLCFFQTQLSASQLFAAFQITDTQQNTHMSIPAPVVNPNLETVSLLPRIVETDMYRMKVYMTRDTSPLDPGINLVVEVTNRSRWTARFTIINILLNGTQNASPSTNSPIYLRELQPTETRVDILHIDQTALAGLTAVTSLRFDLNSYYYRHTTASTTETLLFELSDCPLDGIASALPPTIAEQEQDGLTWQLVELRRNRYGEIQALLRIINQTDEAIIGFCYPAVNGMIVDRMEYPFLNAPPHSVTIRALPLENRSQLQADLHVNGRSHWYTLSADQVMERHGITEIASLKILLQNGYQLKRSATLTLNYPWKLDSTTPAGDHAEALPLLNGDIDAVAERLLIADDGVGLRMVFRNHTDRDVTLLIGKKTVNGRSSFPSFTTSVVIPAHGETISATAVYAQGLLGESEPIREIGMAFRINGAFSTPEALVTIPAVGEGSRYMNPDRCASQPAVYARPDFSAETSEWLEPGQFLLQLNGAFMNGSREIFDGDDFDTAENRLRLTVRVTNLTDGPRQYSFSNLVFNGTRRTDMSPFINWLAPGETGESTSDVGLEQLRGLDSITDIRFTVSVYRQGDDLHPQESVVCFRFPDCDISALAPDALPVLAEGTDGFLNWELQDARQDGNGEIILLLHARNDTEEELRSNAVEVAANGVIIGRISDAALKAGTDQYFELRFSDQIQVRSHEVEVYNYPYTTESLWYPLESDVLERRGISALSEIRLISGLNYSGSLRADRIATLPLKAPIPLRDTPVMSGEQRFTLAEGEGFLSIYATSVLVGENGAALALDLVNNSSYVLLLTPEDPIMNGVACSLYGSYHSITLPPQTTRVTYLAIQAPSQEGLLSVGHSLQDISLTWKLRLGDPFTTDFTLMQEAPIGAEGGVVVTGDKFLRNASKIKMLVYTQSQKGTDTAAPVRLAPMLDADRVARFESGSATVYAKRAEPYRYPTEEEEDDLYLPTRGRVCTVYLSKDEAGVVAADYSGLAWVNTQDQMLEYVEIADEETAGSSFAALLMGLYKDPDILQKLPPEMSLSDSPLDAYLLTVYLIRIEENTLEILSYYTETYTDVNMDLDITAQLISEETIQVGAAEQQVIYMKDGLPAGIFFEKYQVVRLDDLRFVRVDGLTDELYVYYDITYTDGTHEQFFEPYPD